MFFGRALEKREVSYGINDPGLMEFLGITPGEVNVRGRNGLKEATVYACVKILAETMSKLPLKIYQEDGKGISKASNHYLYNTLKLRPNPHMSASDYTKCVETQKNTYGNAYVSIEFDPRTGKVIGLWPLDAPKVKIWIDNEGLINSRSKLWYEVDLNGQKRKLLPEEILHFKSGVTLDGITGVPPLDYLKVTVESAAAAGKFINNFYKQGLQIKGLVQYVGDLDEAAKKVFRERFEDMSSGLKNSHRISLMPMGYKFEPISLSMTDAQFLENTELTYRQIATAFGIKMNQLNDLSKSTHHNFEQQQLAFYTDTMLPTLTMYEQEYTWKLFLKEEIDAGMYARYNVDSILRADIKTRYDAYRIGVQGGFLKPNEARAKEELPPEEGGDQLLVNGNVIPIGMAGQQILKGGDGTGQGEENTDGSQGEAGNAGET